MKEDKNGQTITDKTEIVERWRQYCEDLMAETDPVQEDNVSDENIFTEPDILRNEIETGIRSLRNHKSAGMDGIVAEMVKAAGDQGTEVMLRICNKIWTTGNWPKDWRKSVYIPLHKKGDKEDCKIYRTLALISHASKVMLKVIQERLKPYLLPQIAEEQAGFIPGKGTRDQILNIRQLIEKLYEFNTPAIFCFLDYTKAFDTVNWRILWEIMIEMGIPKHLIFLIKQLYQQNEAFVRIDGSISKQFRTAKGVRQGCVLSPLLFNIYGEWVMRKATENWEGGVSIGGKRYAT